MDSDGDDSFNISLYGSSKFEGKTQKKKMIFLEDSSDESVCDGISNAKRSKRIKEQRKLKLEEMAMKKNPKYRRSLDKMMSGTDSDDDGDESQDVFKEKTRVCTAKFSNPCDLPSCIRKHIKMSQKYLEFVFLMLTLVPTLERNCKMEGNHISGSVPLIHNFGKTLLTVIIRMNMIVKVMMMMTLLMVS